MSAGISNMPLKTFIHAGQAVKKWVHDGVVVWRSAVTLTNLVGSEYVHCSHNADAAEYGDNVGHDLLTVSTTAGHRYFIYWNLGQWGEFDIEGNPENRLTLNPGSTVLASSGGSSSADGMTIVTATDSYITLNHNGWMKTFEGYSAGINATAYMIVDLTELEAAAGITYTAESFWSAIGSSVFYDTKEIEI